MLLPRWPAPAGRGQRVGPWPHSDTFSITKKNNSSQTKKTKTKHEPQRQTRGGRGGLDWASRDMLMSLMTLP